MAAQIRRLPSRYSITMTIVLAMIAMYVVNASFSKAAEDSGGLPADKVVAGASTLEATSANSAPIEVLSQRMKVSSTSDLMLQLTSECSILTSLLTDTANQSAEAFGQVKMFITLDGKRVPVTTVAEQGGATAGENGKVVFCNRAYQRTVSDGEGDAGGAVDTTDDYIRTRTANGFNWMALNVGTNYDDPANGNNVIDVRVFAEFTKNPEACEELGSDATAYGATCADALIGNRTLIVEPTHAAVGEKVEPAGAPTPAA